MARTARPWYSAEKKCYMAHVRGRKVRLISREQNETNHKKAAKKLRQIVQARKDDPAVKSRITSLR